MMKWLYLACGLVNFTIVIDLFLNNRMPSLILLNVWGFYFAFAFIFNFYQKYVIDQYTKKITKQYDHIINNDNLTDQEKGAKIAEALVIDLNKRLNDNNQTGDKK